MANWSELADDMKMVVTIYKEVQAGRPVWFTRLAELLKDDGITRSRLSYLEDRLYDLGIIDKQWEKVEKKWTYCYRVCKCPLGFIKNVADNVVRPYDNLIDCSDYPQTKVRKRTERFRKVRP